MALDARAAPLYMQLSVRSDTPIAKYTMQLPTPIIIERHRHYKALAHFITVTPAATDVRKWWSPCHVHIDNMWAPGNEKERRLVREDNCKSMPLNIACTLPHIKKEAAESVRMLPPSPGVFNHLQISLTDFLGEPIQFTNIYAFIEINEITTY